MFYVIHFGDTNTLDYLKESGDGFGINGGLENSSKLNKRGGGIKND